MKLAAGERNEPSVKKIDSGVGKTARSFFGSRGPGSQPVALVWLIQYTVWYRT
jgi:hypothetical protein